MNWQRKKGLVTGAGGFIGSHMLEPLVELVARTQALVRYKSRNGSGLLELVPASIKNEIEVVLGDLWNIPHAYKKYLAWIPEGTQAR
jgi:uncharacterized protein YbjT (DUF2867 family)